MTGTDTFTNTDLVAVIPEVWTPIVLEQLFARAVAAQWFTNLSEFATEGGDIFHVPDVFTNAFTVQTQSTQGTEVTLGSPTSVDVTLTVNNHIYIAYIIDDLARAQISRSYNVVDLYGRKAGSTIINDLEGDLFALWSGLTTNSIGDTATVLSDSEIRQSVEALASANFDLNESAWFFHPYVYWNQLLAVQKYYDQSQFSNRVPGPTLSGSLDGRELTQGNGLTGQLYGIPVFLSTNVVSGLQTYRNLLAHRSAFGYAIQNPGVVRTRAAEWLANLGVLTVHDMINGTGELRDAAAVLVNASSAFLGS